MIRDSQGAQEENMALSNSQYDSIMRIYNQTQLREKRELDRRREEVYQKIPAVKELTRCV